MKNLKYLHVFILLIIGIQCRSQVISTIAGNGTPGFFGDGGPSQMARISEPYGIAMDDSGSLYICDYGNARVRKINKQGIISTFAGNGDFVYAGDGGLATEASMYIIEAVAVDTSHNVYIIDEYNSVVRKVNAAGIISTFAGNGTVGYSGDGGPATSAQFHYPGGVATDRAGNVYIQDNFNNVIRRVDAAGIITAFAGTGVAGYSGDGGPAALATLNMPLSIATDHTGNVYISDGANYVIRKVDTAGIINTIAGNGTEGYSGDGGPATSASIVAGALFADAAGNVYITGNDVVRKINTAGIITTVAGDGFGTGSLGFGTAYYYGDGGEADSAEINGPASVVVDGIGNMYISDHNDNAIRKVSGISGMTRICTGDSSAFNPVVAGGVWSSSAPAVANVSTSGMVSGISAGTAIIYYSIGADTATTTIYVNAIPTAGTITGADSMCLATTITLADTTPGGIWSISNTNLSAIGGKITSIQTGIDTVFYKMYYTCGVATAQFPVTIIHPSAGIITGPDTVCAGDTAIFTGTATGGIWEISDSTIAGIIAPGIVATAIPGFNAIEYVVTTSVPGCSVIASIYFFIDTPSHCAPTSVPVIIPGNSATILYPNPTSGALHIEVAGINEERNIIISDVFGRPQYTSVIAPGTTAIDLDLQLPNGIYTCAIQGSNYTEVHKILIK